MSDAPVIGSTISLSAGGVPDEDANEAATSLAFQPEAMRSVASARTLLDLLDRLDGMQLWTLVPLQDQVIAASVCKLFALSIERSLAWQLSTVQATQPAEM